VVEGLVLVVVVWIGMDVSKLIDMLAVRWALIFHFERDDQMVELLYSPGIESKKTRVYMYCQLVTAFEGNVLPFLTTTLYDSQPRFNVGRMKKRASD
jgi:hypothetical protein